MALLGNSLQPIQEDHGPTLSPLELGLKTSEIALAHSEEQEELLRCQLRDAKHQIALLGDEADEEIQGLVNELEQQEAELDRLQVAEVALPGVTQEELEMHLMDVRKELKTLRHSEETSLERHANVQEMVEAELATIGSLMERNIYRRESSEQTAHRYLTAAQSAENMASIAASAIANAEAAHTNAISSAAALHEDCEREAAQAHEDRAEAEASFEILQRELSAHSLEIQYLSNSHLDAEESNALIMNERDAVESLSEERESESTTLQSEVDALKDKLVIVENELSEAEGGIQRANLAFENQLQDRLESRVRKAKPTYTSEVAAQVEARQAAAERERLEMESIAARRSNENDPGSIEARWLRLFRGVHSPLVEESIEECCAAWAFGTSRARVSSRIVPASAEIVKEVERQMHQGERRLQVLEQLHNTQIEAANSRASAAAAKFREAQAYWQRKIMDLRAELHQTRGTTDPNCASDGAVAGRRPSSGAGLQRLQVIWLKARLREEAAEVKKLQGELTTAEEAIGILVAGSDGAPR